MVFAAKVTKDVQEYDEFRSNSVAADNYVIILKRKINEPRVNGIYFVAKRKIVR